MLKRFMIWLGMHGKSHNKKDLISVDSLRIMGI